MTEALKRTPLFWGAPWNSQTEFPIVKLALLLVWLVRLASPSEWLFAPFKVKGANGRFHANAPITEFYVLGVSAMSVTFLFSGPSNGAPLPVWCAAIVWLVLIDTVRQNFYLMVLRPGLDQDYKPYSTSRSLLLTSIAYLTVTSLYAIAYYYFVPSSFSETLTRSASLLLSVGFITSSDVTGITPKANTFASVLAATEATVGILFLGIIVTQALSRISQPRGQNP